jgi:Tol biopolymer transport system component
VGGAGVPPAGAAAISANGRYVVFEACFDNLVAGPTSGSWLGDTNHSTDIFVHDRASGKTTLVSVDSQGRQAIGASGSPTISSDGRYVTFDSGAPNLVSSACSSDPIAQVECAASSVVPIGSEHVYVHDNRTGKTTLIDVSTSGGMSNGASYGASISPDGRFVAFTSSSSDLIADDTNACPAKVSIPSCLDVFLRDLSKGTTELVSVGLDGQPANDESGDGEQHVQSISADDRYVAFVSQATDLVPNSNGASGYSVYVRDRKTRRTERVSVDSTGQPLEAQTYGLSPDGRYVAMASILGLVCASASSRPGVVGVYDRTTGATEAVGRINYQNHPNDCSDYYNAYGHSVSRGGRLVAFTANGNNNLVRTGNSQEQVFVRDRGPDLGAGGLARAGTLSVAGASSFASTGVVSAVGTSRLDPVLSAIGADLIAASVAYRPGYGDLFARLQVAQMPLFAAADPTLVYGVNLTIGGTAYEVRASKTGLDASFGLFRAGPLGWTHIASLKGGYGTTGEEVVFSLPLKDLDAQTGGRLSGLRAFAAGGSYLTGAAQVFDEIALSQ